MTRRHVGKPRVEEQYLGKYVNQVIEGMQTGYFTCLAHPDIINYVGDGDLYEKHMRRLAEEMKKLHIPLEVNVSGYRDACHYPNKGFVRLAVETGNDFVIGVDAHAPWELTDTENYNACVDLVKCMGGNIINI